MNGLDVLCESTSLRDLWLFASMENNGEGPCACLLAEFTIEISQCGHYSIMGSLAENGF